MFDMALTRLWYFLWWSLIYTEKQLHLNTQRCKKMCLFQGVFLNLMAVPTVWVNIFKWYLNKICQILTSYCVI